MQESLVNEVQEYTNEYLEKKSKKDRKKIGQFFTPAVVADFMASLSGAYNNFEELTILDCGSGTGILAAALIDKFKTHKSLKRLHIDLYELDNNVLPILTKSMEYIKHNLENLSIEFTYEIIHGNFVTLNVDNWNSDFVGKYDLVISNPPYKKISKSSEEAVAMSSIVHGQPNIYFLFMAMALKLLKENGELIFINPRSFTSGLYFKKFRTWFLENTIISRIHLFVSRKNVFGNDQVLQETIILKALKSKSKEDKICISESTDSDLSKNIFQIYLPYDSVITKNENKFILLPTTEEDIQVMNLLSKWKYNLVKLGYKLKTGPVVDFRSLEYLKNEPLEETVPLLWLHNFNGGLIRFPVTKEGKPQYILNNSESKNLLLENKDYLLLKRFTSKEEKRRLQAAIYSSKEFNYSKIGFENHLNYIVKESGIMELNELYGLYALFNSDILDKYYRIVNGSTQVNATEVNSMPLPEKELIIKIGDLILKENDLSVDKCNDIVNNIFNI